MEGGGGSEPREAGHQRALQLSRHSVDSARSANTSAATTVATATTGGRWSSAATTSSLLHQVAARVGALDDVLAGEARAGPLAAAGSDSGSAEARPPGAALAVGPLPVHVVVCQPDGTLELAVDPNRLAKPPGPEGHTSEGAAGLGRGSGRLQEPWQVAVDRLRQQNERRRLLIAQAAWRRMLRRHRVACLIVAIADVCYGVSLLIVHHVWVSQGRDGDLSNVAVFFVANPLDLSVAYLACEVVFGLVGCLAAWRTLPNLLSAYVLAAVVLLILAIFFMPIFGLLSQIVVMMMGVQLRLTMGRMGGGGPATFNLAAISNGATAALGRTGAWFAAAVPRAVASGV